VVTTGRGERPRPHDVQRHPQSPPKTHDEDDKATDGRSGTVETLPATEGGTKICLRYHERDHCAEGDRVHGERDRTEDGAGDEKDESVIAPDRLS
jgi:hypothetical protein